MANFGIGIGAFADGFTRGMSIGERYRKASKDWEIEKAQNEAMDAAKAARDAQIDEQASALMQAGPQGPQGPEAAGQQEAAPTQAQAAPVSTPNVQPVEGSTPSPATRGIAPPDSTTQAVPVVQTEAPAAPTQGQAAERTIETPAPAAPQPAQAKPAAAASVLGLSGKPMTKEQARSMAEKSTPGVLEFMQKQGTPRVAEAYLRQGDIAKAEAWTKWAEDGEGKRTMKTWAKAWSATQRGDLEGAATHVFDLYKGYADGSTPISKEVVKDKSGAVTGFNVRLRDDVTGEERDSFVDRDQLLNMGLTALSPPQMFEQAYKTKQAQDKAKADAAAEAGKLRMQAAKDIAVERAKQGGRVELEGIKAGNETTRDARKHENDLERDSQKSQLDAQNQRNKVQQELDAKVSTLQKAGYSEEFIKEALPDMLGVNQYKKTTSPEEAKRLAHSDRMKNDPSYARKPADQQRAILDQDMALIFGGMKPSAAPGASSAAPANPAARGLPVLDKKTGQVVYR